MCLNSLFCSSITFKPFSSNKYNMQWVVIRPAFIVLFQFPCMFFRLVSFVFYVCVCSFWLFCLGFFPGFFLCSLVSVFFLEILCMYIFLFSVFPLFSLSLCLCVRGLFFIFQTVFETIYIYILIFCIISYLLIKRNFRVNQKASKKSTHTQKLNR